MAVGRGRAEVCVEKCNAEEIRLQDPPGISAVASAREDRGLEPSDWVFKGQEVVPHLLGVDDGAFRIRQAHGPAIVGGLPSEPHNHNRPGWINGNAGALDADTAASRADRIPRPFVTRSAAAPPGTLESPLQGRWMHLELTAVFRKVPEGYVAFVEELPGANTQGATLEEARRNLREAVELVLQANRTLAEADLGGSEVIREPLKLST